MFLLFYTIGTLLAWSNDSVGASAANLCEMKAQRSIQECFSSEGAVSASDQPVDCQGHRGQNWVRVWGDEFDDPSQFEKNWTFETGGWGWFNGEWQHYTDRPENHVVERGLLKIIARQERYSNDGYTNDYTSAKVVSRGLGFVYGRFEIRARLPKGPRLWPAAWLLARNTTYGQGDEFWPNNGEIDLMEYNIFGDNLVFSTVHTAEHNHRNGNGWPIHAVYRDDISTAFHTYAVEWGPRELKFFFNGKLTGTYPNKGTGWKQYPFDQPFYLIMNLAVQGEGAEIDPRTFPAQVEVDYVRVFAPVGGDFCKPADRVADLN